MKTAGQEALVTDVQGAVVEGVSSNCFIRTNEGWITPELRYNGVHGVMRAEILKRMQQHGITLHTTPQSYGRNCCIFRAYSSVMP